MKNDKFVFYNLTWWFMLGLLPIVLILLNFNTSKAQIPEVVESEENILHGNEIIELARTAVFKDIKLSDFNQIKYSVIGESIETERYGDKVTGRTITKPFKHNDLITLNSLDILKLQLKANINGHASEITHLEIDGNTISTPDVLDFETREKLGLEYVLSIPQFNKRGDARGDRYWIFIFPMLMRLDFREDKTKYIYVGKAESSTGVADVVATKTLNKLSTLLFFDESTHLLLKMIIKRSFGDINVFFSDYKIDSKMMIPHKINIDESMEYTAELIGEKRLTMVREMKLKNFSIAKVEKP